MTLPLGDRPSLAMKGYAMIRACVVGLFQRQRPAHVARDIVAGVVREAINRVQVGRSMADVAQKDCERPAPLVVHPDASSAVQVVVDVLRVVATCFRGGPRVVLACTRPAVSSSRRASDIAPPAATTRTVPSRQLVADDINDSAALAAASPDSITDVRLLRCSGHHRQAMKHQSSQVANVRPLRHSAIIPRNNTIGFASVVITAALSLWPQAAYSQGTPIPWTRPQFFDNSGAVCGLCELNSYAAGTTTRQDIFSNITLTTATANPLILDAAGRPTTNIYLSATSYRFVLTSSGGGTTYWDADNTPSIPATSLLLLWMPPTTQVTQ